MWYHFTSVVFFDDIPSVLLVSATSVFSGIEQYCYYRKICKYRALTHNGHVFCDEYTVGCTEKMLMCHVNIKSFSFQYFRMELLNAEKVGYVLI